MQNTKNDLQENVVITLQKTDENIVFYFIKTIKLTKSDPKGVPKVTNILRGLPLQGPEKVVICRESLQINPCERQLVKNWPQINEIYIYPVIMFKSGGVHLWRRREHLAPRLM